MTTLEKIKAEIRKMLDRERDFTSENAKAQALALMWVLELIDKYAEQEPKTGHWKRISMDRYTTHAQYWYECDKCGEHNLGNANFCPNCGAKMVEPKESDEISEHNMKMWEEIFKAERNDKE